MTIVGTGTPTQQGHYPFGENWYPASTTEKWKFTSYERDTETGNDYAIFRSYVNRYGRFLTPDPAGVSAGSVSNPQTWNRYAYVGNNPTGAWDPLGLCPVDGYVGSNGKSHCSSTQGSMGCAMDPVCSGVGVYVDGVFTTTAMGDALTHSGVGQMCSVCEGVVIKQDSQGNIVSAKWVRFEIHDAGRVTESGLFSGYFDVFSAPPGATKNAVTYKIDSPFGHSTAAAVEAPGPAGSLQSCVWGVRLGTPCREGL